MEQTQRRAHALLCSLIANLKSYRCMYCSSSFISSFVNKNRRFLPHEYCSKRDAKEISDKDETDTTTGLGYALFLRL